MPTPLDDIKRQVAIANRVLSAMGLATGHRLSLGHASMRVPGRPDQFVVKGRGYALDALPAMRPENMILCDIEGNKVIDGYTVSVTVAVLDSSALRPSALPTGVTGGTEADWRAAEELTASLLD